MVPDYTKRHIPCFRRIPIGGRRADGVDDVLADRPASGYGSPQGYPHCCITQQSSSTYPLFSRSRWHAAFRISYGTPHGYLPPLLGDADLPGPICLNRLHSLGVVCKLDNDNAYSYHDSRTLYGRASIISTLMPSRSVACAGTAAWVWLGGMFPNTIDIISKAHYRTARYGRKVSVFNRQAPDEHVTDVGPITVTTPTRTACDLAMNCTPETQSPVTEIVCMLMQEFRFRPDDCLQVMQEATHIRNAPRARQFFRTIDGKQ